MRGHAGNIARAGPSNAATFDHAEDSQVDNTALGRRRRPQSGGTDWLVTSPQPRGPIDAQLISSYGGHIAKVALGPIKKKHSNPLNYISNRIHSHFG